MNGVCLSVSLSLSGDSPSSQYSRWSSSSEPALTFETRTLGLIYKTVAGDLSGQAGR